MSAFQKATRKQAKIRIALTGPSGAGKTFSALLIASGIGKRIAVIDTENYSASICADRTEGPLAGIDFDIVELDPPYTVAKYLANIEDAEKSGYDVLIIDSLSHAWAGEGGLLNKKSALDARGGNSYVNWGQITPEQDKLVAKLLHCGVHLICTMRSKQDYILEMNDKGKQAPKKVGLAPIQREGMEFEFTTVFDLAMDHNAASSKDRTSLFDGQFFKPTAETGKKIKAWFMAGKPIPKAAPPLEPAQPASPAPGPAPEPEPEAQAEAMVSQAQLDGISAGIKKIKALGILDKTIWDAIRNRVQQVHRRDFAEPSELTGTEGKTVIDYLSAWETKLKAPKKADKPAAKEARA